MAIDRLLDTRVDTLIIKMGGAYLIDLAKTRKYP